MSRVFAYCRVSTSEQTTANQVREIAAAGFAVEERRVVEETISGSTCALQRPGFAKLVDRLETGDVLIVTKIDRLGRSAVDVVNTVEKLKDLGVRVHCMQLGGTDLTSAAGKLLMTVMAAMAEFERGLLLERTRMGMDRARAEGKQIGGVEALSQDQQREAVGMMLNGESISAIARHLGTSRTNIQRLRKRKSVNGGAGVVAES